MITYNQPVYDIPFTLGPIFDVSILFVCFFFQPLISDALAQIITVLWLTGTVPMPNGSKGTPPINVFPFGIWAVPIGHKVVIVWNNPSENGSSKKHR